MALHSGLCNSIDNTVCTFCWIGFCKSQPMYVTVSAEWASGTMASPDCLTWTCDAPLAEVCTWHSHQRGPSYPQTSLPACSSQWTSSSTFWVCCCPGCTQILGEQLQDSHIRFVSTHTLPSAGCRICTYVCTCTYIHVYAMSRMQQEVEAISTVVHVLVFVQ